MAGFIHWQSRDQLDQAALVCHRQTKHIDWADLERWFHAEGASQVLLELRRAIEALQADEDE